MGTHLRNAAVVAVTAPEVVGDQEPEYPVSHFVVSLVSAYTYTCSQDTGETLKTCLTGLRMASCVQPVG